MEKLRILLAEDHRILREGLKRLIDEQPNMEVVGEADNGIAAWQKAKELEPDVVLMDISMPRLNGAEATIKIKELCPNVKIVALTGHRASAYLNEVLKAGASGYVLKQAAIDELIEAIQIVAKGGNYIDRATRDSLINSPLSNRVYKGEPQGKPLSQREIQILSLVAQG